MSEGPSGQKRKSPSAPKSKKILRKLLEDAISHAITILCEATDNPGISIRMDLPDERNELEDLQRRASLAVEKYQENLLAHPEAIHLPLSQMLEDSVRVAEIAGQIVGFSAVLPKTTQTFDLDGLFVEPLRWRGGIGRELIADAVQYVKAQGGTAIEVVANPVAELFYEKNGFEKLGWVETQFGPAHIMRRLLQS